MNALKHHAGYIRAKLKEWENILPEDFNNYLLSIGDNQFDIYTGNLSVAIIGTELNEHLLINRITTRIALHLWLGRQGYKTVTLSDASRWVIRESDPGEDFAHVHPARNQAFVRRIKAKHLKTAIILISGGLNLSGLEFLTTEQINRIRLNELGISPVKSIRESRNIAETIALLLIPYLRK
jgi:hypothetical protein